MGPGLGVQGFRTRVEVFRARVRGLGGRVQDLGLRAQVLGFKVQVNAPNTCAAAIPSLKIEHLP